MSKLYLSVVIPCFNEERNIRLGALENVAHFLSKKKFSWEIILVNDGSSDESVKLIKDFIKDHRNILLLNRNHQGKAAAVTAGMLRAEGEIILFTDLDQATPINQIDIILPYFSQDHDIVIGSRNNQRRGAPIFRLAMARGFMMLRNLILNLGIKDTQCGFKVFKRNCAYDIFPRLKVFNLKRKNKSSTVTAGFDVELLYIAKLFGYKIKEVPVEWHYQETRHVSPIKDSLEGVADLVKIRLNTIKGIYNK
jgi:dolichyl-phosphate beta-glucosyltransferase